MIKRLTAEYIDDIAIAHRLAWQAGFRGILSDPLLDTLTDAEFIEGWKDTIRRSRRTNLIKVIEYEAVGFVSFGSPYDAQETVKAEIYGIYVHPHYWRKKIGYELITAAMKEIRKKDGYNGAILWTMSKNTRSAAFYREVGFRVTNQKRTSQRNGEFFEEVKCQYDAIGKSSAVCVKDSRGI